MSFLLEPLFQPTKTHRNLPDLDEHVVLGTFDVLHAVRQKALRDRSDKERGGADPDHHHDDREDLALCALRSDVAIADRRHRGDGPVHAITK